MRHPFLAAFVVLGVLALGACSDQTDCSPNESSSTVTVTAAKPGVTGVECWSGCAPGQRDLEASGSGEWTATLAEGEPDRVTLAARGDDGVNFAQRFNVEWAGCPAAPTERELVLLRPEGGTGAP
jgi:formylmethanofuran dehydrogenase subunit E